MAEDSPVRMRCEESGKRGSADVSWSAAEGIGGAAAGAGQDSETGALLLITAGSKTCARLRLRRARRMCCAAEMEAHKRATNATSEMANRIRIGAWLRIANGAVSSCDVMASTGGFRARKRRDDSGSWLVSLRESTACEVQY